MNGAFRTCFLLSLSLLICCPIAQAQKEEETIKDYFSINGYIKYMNSSSFVNLNNLLTDNLIHNRINLKTFLSDNFTIVMGMRNRIFYGEGTKINPYLGSMLEEDMGEVDLSFVLLDEGAMVIHSILDRAYMKYISEKWEVRLGRQRINWGMNLAWNPNDLFNAYSLIDFDYQERPGSDAMRIQYFMKGLSSIDLAYPLGEDLDRSIVAGILKFNKWEYDFQVLGANYYTDIALGTGWAGNLKNMGFKGEATYFHPKESFSDTNGMLSTSATLDYSFKNGLYLNSSVLYNSGGSDDALITASPVQSFIGTLSAKNLMPSKLTYFLQGSGAFNPALTGSFSIFYMQGLNTFFWMPSISYNIQENWEVMLLGQSAVGEIDNDMETLANFIYLRLMFSF